MPLYHKYRDPDPSRIENPNAITWEDPADWPRTYRYVPASSRSRKQNYTKSFYHKGIHPPAPVYQGGAAFPTGMDMGMGYGSGYTSGYGYQYQQPFGQAFNQMPYSSYYGSYPSTGSTFPFSSSYSSYYPYSYPSSCSFPSRASLYYPTFMWNSSSRPNTTYWTAPGQPAVFPMPQCPQSMSAQAAAAAATNAQLASMPSGPSYFVGSTPADIAAQQSVLYGMNGMSGLGPNQLAPYKPAAGQQFWCKETDGSWTLRTHTDIINGDMSPGHWERHPQSGYFYWVRQVG